MSYSQKDYISGSGSDTIISTIISNFIVKKFELDYSYIVIIFAVVMNMINFIRNDFDIKLYLVNVNIYFWIFFIICFVCFSLRKHIKKYLKCKSNKKYIVINIYDPNKIVIFKDYMKYFPEYFTKIYDIDVGNQEFIGEYMTAPDNQLFNEEFYTTMNMISAVCDINIEFDDKNLNTKGYISWDQYEYTQKIQWLTNNKNTTQTEHQQKKINIKYMKLYLDRTSLSDVNDYLKNIQKIVESKQNTRDIQKYYIKVLKNTTDIGSDIFYHTVRIYDGPRCTIEENEKIYIDTFFHKERDRLWSYIKNIHKNPDSFKKLGQSPRLNLLLYGPPGSGKSSLAYRIAMTLQRHLVSLDLREIKNKKTIYQVLHCPYDYKPEEVVFILDEFDLTIKHLYNTDKMRKECLKMKYDEQYITEKIKSIKYNNNNKKNKGMKKIKQSDIDSTSNSDDELLENKSTNFTNESGLIGEPSDNEFTLKDLLEIFQGAVPIDKMIIIATTNDYEGIKELCPELFRPSRLTPIEFGYLDKNSLQSLSKFYFNKELELDLTSDLIIPTSQVVEKALEIRSADIDNINKFNMFQQSIAKLNKS